LSKSDLFLSTMTEKLLTYALGRGLEPYDMPTVRKIVRQAAKKGDGFSAFIMGVVRSPAFQMRTSAPQEDQEDKELRVSARGDEE
ncbi:MAG TPA: DUF1585 domain-containing protein, partial [Gammaproteobacteria bacterium]|nr:DUF1585 domain-containing protein [Gammaproteobacteria bacterium]